MIDLTERLLKAYNDNPKVRKIGRYSVSELWAIMNGYLSPEDYLKSKPVDFEGAMNMWQGTHKHIQVQSLLYEYEKEVKEVLTVKAKGVEFEVVGMCDALKVDEGLEIKTSKKIHEKSKAWHDYQARIYCTMFNRPLFRIVQPVVTKDRLYLNVLAEIKRNDKWFKAQMDKLADFHVKLLKLKDKQ